MPVAVQLTRVDERERAMRQIGRVAENSRLVGSFVLLAALVFFASIPGAVPAPRVDDADAMLTLSPPDDPSGEIVHADLPAFLPHLSDLAALSLAGGPHQDDVPCSVSMHPHDHHAVASSSVRLAVDPAMLQIAWVTITQVRETSEPCQDVTARLATKPPR